MDRTGREGFGAVSQPPSEQRCHPAAVGQGGVDGACPPVSMSCMDTHLPGESALRVSLSPSPDHCLGTASVPTPPTGRACAAAAGGLRPALGPPVALLGPQTDQRGRSQRSERRGLGTLASKVKEGREERQRNVHVHHPLCIHLAKSVSWLWWCTPVTSALRGLRREDHHHQLQPSLGCKGDPASNIKPALNTS